MRVSSEMRLLVLSNDKFPPFRVDVTVLFGKELARSGFNIDWILQSDKACEQDMQAPYGGGMAYVGRTDLGTSRRHRLHKHWLAFRHDMKVGRLARAGRYDVIQVKDKVLATLPALWAARRNRAAFVYWLSFPNAESSLYLARTGAARYPVLYRLRGWSLFWLLYRVILPRADHIFVQSEQMKQDLASYGLDPAKMTPVPMGIQLEDFAGITAPVPTPVGSGPVVGYLGTLAGERRMDFLVRVFALVLQAVPDAKLLFVGDGDRPGDAEAIREEARRLGIFDRVEITGFLPRHEALRRIVRADVCASPFYPTPILNSTSPTKLVEYMALGRPVVANDHPEQRLVIEGSRAGLCVPYDEAAFAQALVKILQDPREAAAMGERGRAYVERHRDYRGIGAQVAQKFRELVARRNGSEYAPPGASSQSH